MPFTLLLGIAVLQGANAAPTPDPAPATRVAAVRAVVPPVVDGRDDDAVWQEAQPITEFRVFRPVDGAIPKFRTEARVAYDAFDLPFKITLAPSR